MSSFDYLVLDPAGLHARPAGLLVKSLAPFDAEMTISNGVKQVSAKKLFAVMGLGVKAGQTITITAEGPQAFEALTAARASLDENLAR
ncbi:MAG: HPr family phosphocarrier protein [Propionibacteriaceae bacterium]|jgi:phosphocarrier protein|nr:HPr family phosphocarrier protein [Propionibacteriaceae bacterium]